MDSNIYEQYINKFIDNIVSMNVEIKTDSIKFKDQRIKILGFVKNLLSSISIIQYRSAIEQFTQLHLDLINNIEFDKQYQRKLDEPDEPDEVDEPDSSNPSNHGDEHDSSFKIMCDDVDNINVFVTSSNPVEIPDKYLPIRFTRGGNTKAFTFKEDEVEKKKKKKRNSKKLFDTLEEYDASKTDKVYDLNNSDDFIIFRDDELSNNTCKCRVKLISNKGRIYKKKVDALTPIYYYRDKDGYYYGEQCSNKAHFDSIYCDFHKNLYVTTGEVDLISMPPKLENDDSSIKKILITKPDDIIISSQVYSPPDSPVYTPPDSPVYSPPDSPIHNSPIHNYNYNDDYEKSDYDIKLDDMDKMIKYNYEGHHCLLNKVSRELYDADTLEFLGSLDDDIDLC